jgi:hypothetical protein
MSMPHTCRCAICGADMGGGLFFPNGPCDCVGAICKQQTTPNLKPAGTYCKMPWANVMPQKGLEDV